MSVVTFGFILSFLRCASAAEAEGTEAPIAADVPVPTPLHFTLEGGVSTASDTATSAMSVATSFGRKPQSENYGFDPLEFSVTAGWRRATAKGAVTNDQWLGGVRIDLNRIVGPATLFWFANAERNLPANRRLDLLVAPVGVKLDLYASKVLSLDFGFAPVWNYRALAVDGGDCTIDGAACSVSKMRGSFRLRAAVDRGAWHLEDQLGFLPSLYPVPGGLVQAIADEAIVRNDARLSFKMGKRVSLVETLALVRDPLLAAQADCTGEQDTTLCKGWSLNTGTTLGVDVQF